MTLYQWHRVAHNGSKIGPPLSRPGAFPKFDPTNSTRAPFDNAVPPSATMKTPTCALTAFFALAALLAAAPPSNAAHEKPRTIQEVFDEGRAAFFRNDFATARRLLTRVNKADPKHRPTIIMLRNITMAEQEAAARAASLEGRMQRTTLPRLDLVDARVPDVLEFIQLKAAQASKDGARPNFVIRLTEQDQKRAVTLQLSQPTLHGVLAALSTLADLDIAYETHAVTIRSRSLAPAVAQKGAEGTPPASGDGTAKRAR